MRFASSVTEAHRWWKEGDHPAVDTYQGRKPPGLLHRECGAAWGIHGWFESREVCPGDWIVATGENLEVIHDDPFDHTDIIEEVKGKQTRAHPLGGEYTTKVVYYADCTEHARRKFTDREERDTWAETHAQDKQHAVHKYEVEN